MNAINLKALFPMIPMMLILTAIRLAADESSVSFEASVTVTVHIEGKGTVTKTSGTVAAEKHSAITLLATPAEGYVFGGWKEVARPFRNPLPLRLTGITSITAQFLPADNRIIMDNTQATFIGVWTVGAMSPGKFDKTYHFATSVSGPANARATYCPQLPCPGLYDVYIWYPAGVNRTTNALWTVTGTTAAVAKSINQRRDGGKWVSIAAAIEMNAEGTVVELANGTGESGAAVVADAVAFVFIGGIRTDSGEAETVAVKDSDQTQQDHETATPQLATINVAK